MSKGYTIALAMTAPVAPATASPHGGSRTSFDCADIVDDCGKELLDVCLGIGAWYAQQGAAEAKDDGYGGEKAG